MRKGGTPGGVVPAFRKLHPWALRGFRLIARHRLRTSFQAVRVTEACKVEHLHATPTVVYLNHPSWWDPLVGFVLAEHLFGERPFYAPIDAASLPRYRVLAHVGMFPVDQAGARGALQFLRTAGAVLDAGHLLGMTPQGQFVDVRQRPPQLRSGLATLLQRRAAAGLNTAALPIAVEYPFWNQVRPEALALCGDALVVGPEHAATADTLHQQLTQRLADAQDRLAKLAMLRDGTPFVTVLEGRRGVAGVHSLWKDLPRLLGRPDRVGRSHVTESVPRE